MQRVHKASPPAGREVRRQPVSNCKGSYFVGRWGRGYSEYRFTKVTQAICIPTSKNFFPFVTHKRELQQSLDPRTVRSCPDHTLCYPVRLLWATDPCSGSRPRPCLQSRELAAKLRGQPEKGRAPFLIEVMGTWPQRSRDREFQLGFREPLMRPAWKTNGPTVQPDTPFPGEELGHLPIL